MRNHQLAALGAVIGLALSCARPGPTLILQGTVLTPTGVLRPGWVVVDGDRISAVTGSPPNVPRALTLDTKAVIVPGLIDLHNHVSWNVFPRWTPPQQFVNRDQWRQLAAYRTSLAVPGRTLLARHSCDMNRYGEIRAVLGGTTSVQGSVRRACAGGLVRNLDFYSEFDPELGSGREPISTIADLTLLEERTGRLIARRLGENRSKALFVHAAEGRAGDPAARNDLTTLKHHRLLGPKTVIIHGSALTFDELRTVRDAGAALVWSPRSNITLYGETTNIQAALDLGIPIALAPDWALTGSGTLLDELRYAARFNEARFSGRLTNQQLVAMVTETPARLAAIDDKVGAIRQGLYADLLVVHGDPSDPYRALVSARPQDVRLVLIGGRPVYGATDIVRRLHAGRDWEDVSICGSAMMLHTGRGVASSTGSANRLDALETRLRRAMEAARGDSTLSPLIECEPPEPAAASPHRAPASDPSDR